jgi:hypothetical protein
MKTNIDANPALISNGFVACYSDYFLIHWYYFPFGTKISSIRVSYDGYVVLRQNHILEKKNNLLKIKNIYNYQCHRGRGSGSRRRDGGTPPTPLILITTISISGDGTTTIFSEFKRKFD